LRKSFFDSMARVFGFGIDERPWRHFIRVTPMITRNEQLKINLELIASMYEAIASLHRDIAPLSFRNYEILAEGPIEQVRRLRQEIDEYLGVQTGGAPEGSPTLENVEHVSH